MTGSRIWLSFSSSCSCWDSPRRNQSDWVRPYFVKKNTEEPHMINPIILVLLCTCQGPIPSAAVQVNQEVTIFTLLDVCTTINSIFSFYSVGFIQIMRLPCPRKMYRKWDSIMNANRWSVYTCTFLSNGGIFFALLEQVIAHSLRMSEYFIKRYNEWRRQTVQGWSSVWKQFLIVQTRSIFYQMPYDYYAKLKAVLANGVIGISY